MLVSSRTTNILLIVILAVGIGIMAMLATSARGGPLDPLGTPGPTLPQVEPRSPIPPVGWNGTFPIVINQSGSYFLTRNLTTPGGAAVAISVTTSDVSIDLHGFTLDGADQTGTGIAGVSAPSRVRVRNGSVTRFATGIGFSGGQNVEVNDVLVTQIKGFGIVVNSTSGRVERCTVAFSDGGIAIGFDGAVRDCHVHDIVGFDGILASPRAIVERTTVTQVGGTDKYGVRAAGADVTIRGNHLDNDDHDIGVGGTGAMIIDNVIHCYTSIVNLGGFSYYAPVDGQEHTNEEKYAAGFC